MKSTILSVFCGLVLISFITNTSNAQTSAAGSTDSTFTPSGKFSAQFFGDVFYKMHADSLARDNNGQYSGATASGAPNVPKNSYDFQLRRVYLGYNYDISKSFTTEFLLAYEEGNAGSTLDLTSERSVYMKLANIRWKNIFANADVIFGAQATPGYTASSEANWGYRSVEKTLTDKNGIIKSSDLGLALRGAFNDAKDYGYDLLLADGTGQKLPALLSGGDNSGRNKKLYVDLWGKFMEKKIVVQVYFDDQKTSDPADQNVSTLKFYAAYATTPLTIGAELFMQTKTNSVKDSNFSSQNNEVADQKPFGFSVFATAQLIENSLNAFARFDMFNPDNNYLTSGVKYTGGDNATGFANTTFIVAGLDWTPYKNVHIMPNLWYQGYTAKATGTTGKVSSDNDIVPRITFFYKY